MPGSLREGHRIVVSYTDYFDREKEIFRSRILGIQEASKQLFPHAPCPVRAFVLEDVFPSTHDYPPLPALARHIFEYESDRSCIYFDENGQPRRIEVRLHE